MGGWGGGGGQVFHKGHVTIKGALICPTPKKKVIIIKRVYYELIHKIIFSTL